MKHRIINIYLMSPPTGLDFVCIDFYHNVASIEAKKSTVGAEFW